MHSFWKIMRRLYYDVYLFYANGLMNTLLIKEEPEIGGEIRFYTYQYNYCDCYILLLTVVWL